LFVGDTLEEVALGQTFLEEAVDTPQGESLLQVSEQVVEDVVVVVVVVSAAAVGHGTGAGTDAADEVVLWRPCGGWTMWKVV
jgi:hypothetical protein